MNVVVKHDGTDISNWVIAYDREHSICTGVGSLELTVPISINRTFIERSLKALKALDPFNKNIN